MAYQGSGQIDGFDDARSRPVPGVNVRYFITPIYQRAFQLTHVFSNTYHHDTKTVPRTRLRDLFCKKNQKAHPLVHLMIPTPEDSHHLLDLLHITA